MLGKVRMFFKALKAGERVANPKQWKNAQTLGNILSVILVFAASFAPESWGLSNEIVFELAKYLGGLVFTGNVLITNATSRKVGLKKGALK